MVNHIKHPILGSLDLHEVLKFLHVREEYEQQIHVLELSSETRIHAAPWRYSVERKILKALFTLGEFSTVAPGAPYSGITSEHIRELIMEIGHSSQSQNYGAADLNAVARKLRMDMKIRNPKARVQMLIADFSDARTTQEFHTTSMTSRRQLYVCWLRRSTPKIAGESQEGYGTQRHSIQGF